LAPVPVTVYVVVDKGDTVKLAPTDPPGFQLYPKVPPLAINVTLLPGHIVEFAGFIPMLGNGKTFTIDVAVLVQLLAPVPVTVYVVVAAGLAVTEAPVVGTRVVTGLHV
jgi:hypothetical protein